MVLLLDAEYLLHKLKGNVGRQSPLQLKFIQVLVHCIAVKYGSFISYIFLSKCMLMIFINSDE